MKPLDILIRLLSSRTGADAARLALDWLDQHSPEEVREAIGER